MRAVDATDSFSAGELLLGLLLGATAWFVVRCVLSGFFTVDQNERAVKTSFGRADRIEGRRTGSAPMAAFLRQDERGRYDYPMVHVIGPGGPYFKWPWETIHKTSIATQTVSMAYDPEDPAANRQGAMLSAVTKDQLDTGLTGQIRYRVSEQNLYAYFFGVRRPIVHVMGYFVSILRERIASFEAPDPVTVVGGAPSATDVALAGSPAGAIVSGISINDLRKNLRDLNDHMEQECRSSTARYGITLEASLITGVDPPVEVESALAAINTAHNLVSSDISLAQAAADQRIVQSRRAVEIETLRAQAEAEPLMRLADQLGALRRSGPGALDAYRKNLRLSLYTKAQKIILGAPS